jgi:biopolymer transport protein ExbD
MNKNTSVFEPQRLVWVSLLILCSLGLIACSKGSTQQAAAPAAATPKPAPTPSNAKLALNGEPKGTTNDTRELSRMLARIFKEREEYMVFKEGTSDVEKSLYLKADPAIRLGEFLKVLDVAKEAGASPVLFPVEVSGDEGKDIMPERLRLLLTIGAPEMNVDPISRGIELIHAPTVRQSEKETVKEMSGVISVAKDGEYVIDGKAVGKPDLANKIRAELENTPTVTRRVLVLLEGDVTYASLSEIAYAANAANATELHIATDAP